MGKRHKVFVSNHYENDKSYKKQFEEIMGDDFVSRSVEEEDIDDTNLSTERIRQIIRDDYLRDSTVTVVLIGTETWKRKHVDWEIGSSIRETKLSSRSGLVGFLLPTRDDYKTDKFDKCTIPPRLYDNVECKFAKIYNWTTSSSSLVDIIHDAFENRDKINPDNSYPSYRNNRSSNSWC